MLVAFDFSQASQERDMSDEWMIRGVEYGNCNCAWGCPCQFNASSTYGHCEAVVGGIIAEGHFNDTQLDGVKWVMIVQWPGEIADGNGRQQFIVDETATAEQRESMLKILAGESTAPGATHFFVYNSTMSEVLDPIFAPIDIAVDVDARQGRISVGDLVESTGAPITNPNNGEPYQAAIELPNGFEYTKAQMGTGTSRVRAGIELDLQDSYGQFNILHMNQDGVIR
jgi:hypothetical protein